MAIEVTSSANVCAKCGTAFSRKKGFFPASYAPLWKGAGYLCICRDCIEAMYLTYLQQSNDAKIAVRQMCRKLDLYWSDKVYELVEERSTNRSIMTRYMAKLNTSAYVGKCYDDTLEEEGRIWDFDNVVVVNNETTTEEVSESDDPIYIEDDDIEITDDVVRFWGSGYPQSMYKELEQRRRYWMSKMPDGLEIDIGTEALIRQICSLELDINRDRIAGKSIDKSVNALNTLLGSANLKPNQKKDENADSNLANTPLGLWLYRYEYKRPLPEIDEECKDSNHIRKYVFTWMGHLCKMMGKKNAYTKLYEDEIERLRVEMPQYDDDDLSDEEFMMNVMESSD